MSQNVHNPTPNSNLNNDQLLLVNILNSMYNDNLRQIDNLNTYNNEIRNYISNLLNRNRYRGNRMYVNNAPYIIDNFQEFTIPNSQNNWTQNVNNSRTRPRGNSRQPNNLSRIFQSFFDPIDVYPTQSQIEAATRHVRFCDIVSPVNQSCPISLDTFNDNSMVTVIRFCGHIFNTEELNRWFRSNCRCPVCRYDIRNYNSNTSVSNLVNSNQLNVDISNNPVSEDVPQTNTSFEEPIERNTNSLVHNFVNSDLFDNGTQQIINNFLDMSNNSNTDPYLIIDLFTSLQRRP
jgi:hypothetical protein